jgi:hypothetical protein
VADHSGVFADLDEVLDVLNKVSEELAALCFADVRFHRPETVSVELAVALEMGPDFVPELSDRCSKWLGDYYVLHVETWEDGFGAGLPDVLGMLDAFAEELRKWPWEDARLLPGEAVRVYVNLVLVTTRPEVARRLHFREVVRADGRPGRMGNKGAEEKTR